MSGGIEREDEVTTDAALAKALVAAQFPQWSGLPVTWVDAVSTDNDIYRRGEEFAVRLPRRAGAAATIDKEHAWLARLAPGLPLPIPAPVAKGEPACGYPYAWGVVRWLGGAPLQAAMAKADVGQARDLARFVTALHGLDASGGPAPGPHNHWRGAPLRAFDPEMRRRFGWLSDLNDIGAIVSAWELGLAAERWRGSPVWIHGDLKDANLLVRDGALCGVLDWGLAGVGDPAADIAVAWTLFEGDVRTVFKDAVAVDEATWRGGPPWALIEGVLGLSYYRGSTDTLAHAGRRVTDAVLSDQEG
jgi:aminoglycoside phosphotransferase (APT) family kinase protein